MNFFIGCIDIRQLGGVQSDVLLIHPIEFIILEYFCCTKTNSQRLDLVERLQIDIDGRQDRVLEVIVGNDINVI